MHKSIKYNQEMFDNIIAHNERLKVSYDSFIKFHNQYKVKLEDNKSYKTLYLFLDDLFQLIDEIINCDTALYKLSLDNYNHPELYLPSYHLAHIDWKLVMAWERVFNFLGIIYSIEFADNREKNNIKFIYDKLKKENDFKASSIAKLLAKAYSNNIFNEMNSIRKLNDHDLSYHYKHMDKVKSEEVISAVEDMLIFDEINKKITSDFDAGRWDASLKELHYKSDTEMTKELVNMHTNIGWLIELFPELLCTLTACIDTSRQIDIKHTGLYEWIINVKNIKNEARKYNVQNNLLVKIDKQFVKAKEYKSLLEQRIELINRNPKVILYNQTSLDTYNYLTDFLFRFTESIRSIHTALEYLNNNDKHPIYGDKTSTIFLVYLAMLKFYSAYEKLGKFIYVLFDVNGYRRGIDELKNIFFDTVVEKAAIDTTINFTSPFKYAQKLISSPEYKKFMKNRNKIFHGIRPHIVVPDDDLGYWAIDAMITMNKNADMIFCLYDLSLMHLDTLQDTIIREL